MKCAKKIQLGNKLRFSFNIKRSLIRFVGKMQNRGKPFNVSTFLIRYIKYGEPGVL